MENLPVLYIFQQKGTIFQWPEFNPQTPEKHWCAICVKIVAVDGWVLMHQAFDMYSDDSVYQAKW